MKRIAIFAHYDSNQIIDDYVLIYLRNLKECVDHIIFISDCDIPEVEQKKIDDLTLFKYCERRNFSKDFGSYQKGFQILLNNFPELFSQCDEVLFVNDSCYCIRKFNEIFLKMESVECDAWGLTDDFTNIELEYKSYHLQSYFLAFRKTVFQQEFFINFIDKIKHFQKVEDVVKNYEEGISQLLINHNKKLFAYFSKDYVNSYICKNYSSLTDEITDIIISTSKKFNDVKLMKKIIGRLFDVSQHNQIHSNKFFIQIKLGHPLIKRVMIDRNKEHFLRHEISNFWEQIIKKYTDFNCTLIKTHSKRIDVKLKEPSCSAQKLVYVKKIFFQKKITKQGYLLIKFMKIPVIHIIVKHLIEQEQT